MVRIEADSVLCYSMECSTLQSQSIHPVYGCQLRDDYGPYKKENTSQLQTAIHRTVYMPSYHTSNNKRTMPVWRSEVVTNSNSRLFELDETAGAFPDDPTFLPLATNTNPFGRRSKFDPEIVAAIHAQFFRPHAR